jgi:hypothetical protein
MKGDYPRFKATYAHEELVEHFLLSPGEQALIDTCRGDVNRHGMAVLLKAGQYLGSFPDDFRHVPQDVKTFIAHQLHLLWDCTEHYPWRSGTHDAHLALIRQHTAFRYPTGQDKRELEQWLRTQGAQDAPTEDELQECAYTRLRTLAIELPAEQELQRIVRAALHGFFQDLYARITTYLSEEVRTALDQLLLVMPGETQSRFEQLKAEPSAPGVKHLQEEITRLETLRALGVPAEALAVVPWKVLQTLKRRAYK